jgi:hydroxyethylthiazole kinase-like uncharacterized protein yjeF
VFKILKWGRAMNIVTPYQMREIDDRTIRKYKIAGQTLMENAGRAVADQAEAMMGSGGMGLDSKVCIVCGTGNNGGDGFVAARHLLERGFPTLVFLSGRAKGIKGAALANYKKLQKTGIRVIEVLTPKSLDNLKKSLAESRLAIDAIFGTGFRGQLEKITAGIINIINDSGVLVLSVDIPSGVDGETGRVEGQAVRADVTVTLGLLKTGLLFYPGKAQAGKVVITEIGFPARAINEQKVIIKLTDGDLIKGWLANRKPDAHKGSCGTVMVLAGSAGMTGAACLAAESALRSGAGLVYLGIAESLNDIIETKLTEVITKPLPETRDRTLALPGLDRILKLMAKADSALIGPGLSTHPETMELVQNIIWELRIPVVLDADGLNAVSSRAELLNFVPQLILTPHYGELARLIKAELSAIKSNPLKYAAAAAKTFNQIVVLKGAPTVTALPDGMCWINSTGNSGMATAGAGDVLAGLISGLLAQGLSAERAAVLGVYLHGLAGDLAAEEKTEFCMLAGDILEKLPAAYKKLMEVHL